MEKIKLLSRLALILMAVSILAMFAIGQRPPRPVNQPAPHVELSEPHRERPEPSIGKTAP